jgi:hypothetical protein
MIHSPWHIEIWWCNNDAITGNWKTFSSAYKHWPSQLHFIYPDNTQLSCDNAELRMQQTRMQYASRRDLQAYGLNGMNNWRHSTFYGRSRPEHAVSERVMALAEGKRPEAYWFIGLRQLALQRHTWQEYRVDMSQSMLVQYRLVAGWIFDAMPNSKIKGKAFNIEELLQHCDKHW